MAYKALKTFVGRVNARKGEIVEISDELAANLLKVGYIEPLKGKAETATTGDEETPAVKRGRKPKKTTEG